MWSPMYKTSFPLAPISRENTSHEPENQFGDKSVHNSMHIISSDTLFSYYLAITISYYYLLFSSQGEGIMCFLYVLV